jgi:hypothetical protein
MEWEGVERKATGSFLTNIPACNQGSQPKGWDKDFLKNDANFLK